MFPKTTLASMYTMYATTDVAYVTRYHAALEPENLRRQAQAAKRNILDHQIVSGSDPSIKKRAHLYGLQAASLVSILYKPIDLLVGTGRDRGVTWSGTTESFARHARSCYTHPCDTGILGLSIGLNVMSNALPIAVIGCLTGAIAGCVESALVLPATATREEKRDNVLRRIKEMAADGAVIGTALASFALADAFYGLSILRTLTLIIKAIGTGIGFAIGAAVGAAIGVCARGAT